MRTRLSRDKIVSLASGKTEQHRKEILCHIFTPNASFGIAAEKNLIITVRT